jgi:hypothetical protein
MSEYLIAFAMSDTYTTTGMCTAEINIGFCEPYDNFIFSGLPKHFEFVSDRYGNQAPYALNYVLNHLGKSMSMIMFDYYGHPERHPPTDKVLKQAINELYAWAKDI